MHGTKNRIYRTSKVNKADTMFDLTFDPAGVEFLGTKNTEIDGIDGNTNRRKYELP